MIDKFVPLDPKGVTILDPTLKPGEVRIVKNIEEYYGFTIKNETGQHIFVEAIFNYNKLSTLIIRS